MPKKTNRTVILRSYILRRQGNTLDAILDRLSQEFDEDQIPDRSTISRNLKRYESDPPEELAEDAPFKWSELNEIPWESSPSVLGAYAHYMENELPNYSGPFTIRQAKWVWRVNQAIGPQGDMSLLDAPEAKTKTNIDGIWLNSPRTVEEVTLLYDVPSCLSRDDILSIAMEYAWREIHSIYFSEVFATGDLDLWLAFSPWNGPDQLSKYHRARDDFGGFRQIIWHIHNLKWLALVVSDPLEDEYTTFASAFDGLLPSQARIVNIWLDTAEQNPKLWDTQINQWYLEFHRRLRIALAKDSDNDSLNYHEVLLRQIQEELNERERQASKQR